MDLMIYISDNASVYEITEMLSEIESLPVVESTQYTSKESALEQFLELYPEKEDPFTLYGLDNPLPANVKIITEQPDQHQMVIDYLGETAFSSLLMDIESSNENQEIVARLLSVTSFTQKLIIGVVVTFVFGSLLMILNAIHLSIFSRKREIQIMQLVGAKPRMIRFPFLLEGALYSVFAVLFSFALMMIFIEGTNLSSFTNFSEQFDPIMLFAYEILASIIVGVISSYIAISYYIKRTLVLQ